MSTARPHRTGGAPSIWLAESVWRSPLACSPRRSREEISRSKLFPFLALAFVASPLTSTAVEWSVVPKVEISETYNDNILLTKEPTTSVFGTILDLSARLGVHTERGGLEFRPLLRFNRYPGEAGLNSNDQFFNLAGSYAATERAELKLDASYVRDTTLTSELEVSGRVFEGNRKESVRVAPSFDYAVSERNTITLGYSYQDVHFDDVPRTSGLLDFDYHVADARGMRRLSGRDEISASLFVSRFEVPEIRNTTTSYGAQVGYGRAFSETLNGSVAVGVTRSDVELAPFGIQLEDSSTGGVWDLRLSKRFERTEVTAGLSQSLFPSSSGFLRRREQLDLTVRSEFTPVLDGRLSVFAFRNRSLEDRGTTTGSDSFQVSAWLSRRFSKNWVLTGEYRFVRSEPQGPGEARQSNAVFVRLRYSGRKWAWSR